MTKELIVNLQKNILTLQKSILVLTQKDKIRDEAIERFSTSVEEAFVEYDKRVTDLNRRLKTLEGMLN